MERRDSPGCELLARETAQPGVIRRIKEHETSCKPVIRRPRFEAEHPGEPVAECAEPSVGGNGFEVVGSEEYEAPEGVTRTSGSRAGFSEHAVRVALEFFVEHVDN